MQLSDMLSLRDFTAASKETLSRLTSTANKAHVHDDVGKFLDWLEPMWPEFYSKFDRDGLMTFEDFENYVRWEGGYPGEMHQLFVNIKRCGSALASADVDEDELGQVHMRVFLDLRRTLGRNRDLLHSGFQGLQKLMYGKYGSLARAWRSVFDKDDMGKCCYTTWVRGCKAHGFTGDPKKAWQEVTRGEPNRTITLRDWDPETDLLLNAFCKLLTQRHGSLKHGWRELIRQTKGQNGFIAHEEWVEVCSHIGFNKKDAKLLFKCLDADGSRSIDMQEFAFVQSWLDSTEAIQSRAPKERQVLSFREPDMKKYSPQTPTRRSRHAHQSGWHAASGGEDGISSGPDETMLRPSSPVHCAANAEPSSFEFVVELTKAEYEDYLRRRRAFVVASQSSPNATAKAKPDSPVAAAPAGSGYGGSEAGTNASRRPSVLSVASQPH
eukprot:TRINITY_DN35547_c0_g1_i1.p1 TRINITY_DN35547_c0_g1~~TRINITY_DN35547_c0_g1_i1.p1  ORF type:complete len:438 (-),score=60.79 TRINITY_DN35547_c0_g1_i1:99-1412(-)